MPLRRYPGAAELLVITEALKKRRKLGSKTLPNNPIRVRDRDNRAPREEDYQIFKEEKKIFRIFLFEELYQKLKRSLCLRFCPVKNLTQPIPSKFRNRI
jgi:hypothetical protein